MPNPRMSNRVLIAQKIIENDVMLKHIIITEENEILRQKNGSNHP